MPFNTVKSEHTHFAQKYDYDRAINYYYRYYKSPRKRFLNWLEQKMAKRGLALAGNPQQLLDVPCGTGRFWESLPHQLPVKSHVADFNKAMLDVGLEKRSATLTASLIGSVVSAFNLPFADNSFDNIFCMRFLHHINLVEDRMQLLRELARTTADTVCISSWVDATGLKAKIRLKKEAKRTPGKEYNKFVMRHENLLQEFAAAGFEVLGHTDLLPHLSPWRLYTLRKKLPLKITTPTTIAYVCPVCKGDLKYDHEQFICQHDKLAFPMLGKIPMLTQRDAIKLT